MRLGRIKLWSGKFAQHSAIEEFLDPRIRILELWRSRLRAALPEAEREELAQWGRIHWGHNYSEPYCLVVVVAIAALNRPDQDPEQVLRNIEHAGSCRGIFLEPVASVKESA